MEHGARLEEQDVDGQEYRPQLPPNSTPFPSLLPSVTPSHPPSLSPSLLAQGTMKSQSAGQVSVMATKACQLRHGTDPDEKPVVVVEFDTG